MTTAADRIPEQDTLREDGMIGRDRWEEMHRLAGGHVTVAEIARRLDVDRKTVARCLRQEAWQPYQRSAPTATLLTPHLPFLRARAAAVGYSARILWQELRAQHGYAGSYETVKRFVRPLREEGLRASLTWTRFETPPGVQSQIDWGQVRMALGPRLVVRHLFVLTWVSRGGASTACAWARRSASSWTLMSGPSSTSAATRASICTTARAPSAGPRRAG